MHRYYKGFRALPLDGNGSNIFLSHSFALKASSSKNQFGIFKSFDKRSLAAQQYAQAIEKTNAVTLKLVDNAITTGVSLSILLLIADIL